MIDREKLERLVSETARILEREGIIAEARQQPVDEQLRIVRELVVKAMVEGRLAVLLSLLALLDDMVLTAEETTRAIERLILGRVCQ